MNLKKVLKSFYINENEDKLSKLKEKALRLRKIKDMDIFIIQKKQNLYLVSSFSITPEEKELAIWSTKNYTR